MQVQPVDASKPGFVGEILGIDIAKGITVDIAEEIEAAIDIYGVLVFRDQDLDDDQQYSFSEHFGVMEQATGDINPRAERRLSMKINDISNLDKDGNVLKRDHRTRLFGLGNMLWHSDSSFKKIPARYSLLSARIVPEKGGNTQFADMRAAWDTLDHDLQDECRSLTCEHSQLFSRGLLGFDDFTAEQLADWTPVEQRLVRRHPRSHRYSLYLSSHIGSVCGWPVPEGRLFIRDLTEHATQKKFVHTHHWRTGDLVMWDNRVTMHRARRYDHTKPRDLHRTTVSDELSSLERPL